MANSIHDNVVRCVQEEEIYSIVEWAVPFFSKSHPRFSLDRMMPILKGAIENRSTCYLSRTDNSCALFVKEQTPWEPLPTVCDVFIAPKEKTSPFEICRIISSGEAWARSIGSIEFRYGTDGLSDLSGVAQRIGYDRISVNYVKRLR